MLLRSNSPTGVGPKVRSTDVPVLKCFTGAGLQEKQGGWCSKSDSELYGCVNSMLYIFLFLVPSAGALRSDHDHLVPHIKRCAHYLGVNARKDLYHIGIEYQEFKDKRHEHSKNDAFARVDRLVQLIC